MNSSWLVVYVGEAYSDHTSQKIKYFKVLNNRTGILDTDSVAEKLVKWRNWLALNSLEVLFKRDTPLALSGTSVPATTLPQLNRTTPRQNVLMADVGTLSVEYAKSPIRESDEIRAAVTTLGGIFNV